MHRDGLAEKGYVEGHSVAIEYRWAENQIDRLPDLAADLVHRQVTVIAATTTPAALAAKAATTTIPIVFSMGDDPVKLGFVNNLNLPGGRLEAKRLEMLHEAVPGASMIGLLVNSTFSDVETQLKDVPAVAGVLGLQITVLNASSERDVDTAFAGRGSALGTRTNSPESCWMLN